MDITDSQIAFNSEGVCDHCIGYESLIQPEWKKLLGDPKILSQTIRKIKYDSARKEYDCILGMSGGVDSSYLLHLAKEEFGLRPLVFHVDAGWNSQIAVNNIEKMVDGLNLDLFTEVINWEEIKDLQLAYFKSGVPQIDTPQDHAFFATMYKFAEKHNVKNILTGANFSTECIRNPIEWMYYQSDSIQLRDIHKKHGTRPLITYPITSILKHKVYLPYIKRIKVRKLLNCVPYNKKQATQLLIDKYGWQPYPQKHFESRFTRFYEGYWLPEKFGYDTRKVQLSSLIVTGQMSREEALGILKNPALDEATVKQEFSYVASKLNISEKILREYFDAPNKTFRDYRSQENLYSLGAKVMNVLGLEFGGKR